MSNKIKEIFGDDSESDQDNDNENEGQTPAFDEDTAQDDGNNNSGSENEEAASEEDSNAEQENNNNEDNEDNEEDNENNDDGGDGGGTNENSNDNEQEEDNENEQEGSENNENEEANETNEMNNSQEQESQKRDDSDEDSQDAKQAPQAVDVFGDELNDLSGDSDNEENENETLNQSQNRTNTIDDNEEEEQQPEQVINVEIPKVRVDLGKEIHFVKLPNFLSVDPRPFDPEFYQDEAADTDALDEEGKTRIKLKVENTIRWRNVKNKEGEMVKESNARIVRWSDGSLSLHLGNEIFDVCKQYMQGDHNHLFIKQGTGLQSQAVFKTKLAFRPHSTDSLTHRKMTMSLVDRGAKTQKVKILTDVGQNPEASRLEMIKKEEEKLKAAHRRENQQRRLREKSHSKGISSSYLEDKYSDDDDNAISLNAVKHHTKHDTKHSVYSSGDESDRERRLNKAKLNDYDESDDDDHRSNKKKKRIVADDDE